MDKPDEQAIIVFQNIQNLMSSDKVLKLNSIKQLNKIVRALGQERTVNELFPFLKPILDEDKEILLPLAEAITSLSLSYSRDYSN